MINNLKLLLSLCLFFFLTSSANGQESYAESNYDKSEIGIEMKDGTRLWTVIYSPVDKSRNYPVLLCRTPYSSGPYGPAKYKSSLGPSPELMKSGYIIVYQDVRGRWMSEGEYDNMRPTVPYRHENMTEYDESTDTYETIEWLINNVPNNNGNVGMWGISYPGFYAAAALPFAHPALKAVSPQAPIGDFYFDDFHHNGAYMLSYWWITALFGYQHEGPTSEAWYKFPERGTKDAYQFFLDIGPLKNLDTYYDSTNFFWTQLKEHPDYDEFWQKRSIIPHLKDVTPAVMTVGGWFDAEDLYGPLTIYKTIEQDAKNDHNTIVMGPWSHGDWARERGYQAVSNVYFGDSISTFYQNTVEKPFFDYYLKGIPAERSFPEAYMFDTGAKKWQTFESWPPADADVVSFYTHPDGSLQTDKPTAGADISFVSDPMKPVPHTQDIKFSGTPRKYMADDQRFAARRLDVLVFETEILDDPVTLAGEIKAYLQVSTTGTDADWIVKIVDVYPGDTPDHEYVQAGTHMSHYHQMVRSEVIRGRYRESFTNPIPFTPNEVTPVTLQLQDVYHTFKKGHKIQIHIQSTWFPLIDRNPQKYVDNIFYADEQDFIKATHTIHMGAGESTRIEVQVLKE